MFVDICKNENLKQSTLISYSDKSLSENELAIFHVEESQIVSESTKLSEVPVVTKNGNKPRRRRRRTKKNVGFETNQNRNQNQNQNHNHNNQLKERDQSQEYERDQDLNNKSKSKNCSETLNSIINIVPSNKLSYQQLESQTSDFQQIEKGQDSYHSVSVCNNSNNNKLSNKRKYEEIDNNKVDFFSLNYSSDRSSQLTSSWSTTLNISQRDFQKNFIGQLKVNDDDNNNIISDLDKVKMEAVNNDETLKISITSTAINSNNNVTNTNIKNDERFTCLDYIAEGAYGIVYKAKSKESNDFVAIKSLKIVSGRENFLTTSLREINILSKAQHPNIVNLREIILDLNMEKIFLVMDYVEHDMEALLNNMNRNGEVFLPGEVKCLLNQLLTAVAYLHDNWILHRDLKTSNLLLSNRGVLKLVDFGLSREYNSPIQPYTPAMVSLWYRAPEVLLGSKLYSTAIDLWSVGCIFGEFLKTKPLFTANTEQNQVNRIFQGLGTPNTQIWPGYNKLPIVKIVKFNNISKPRLRNRIGSKTTELGYDLFLKFLTYDPNKRISAQNALRHDYFYEQPTAIDINLSRFSVEDSSVSCSKPKVESDDSGFTLVEHDLDVSFRIPKSKCVDFVKEKMGIL